VMQSFHSKRSSITNNQKASRQKWLIGTSGKRCMAVPLKIDSFLKKESVSFKVNTKSNQM